MTRRKAESASSAITSSRDVSEARFTSPAAASCYGVSLTREHFQTGSEMCTTLRQTPPSNKDGEMSKLDRIDYRILEVLQENGRLPVKSIADMVGVSVSPCWQRVKNLEKAGIIRRYTAEIAIEKLQNVQIVLAHVILSKHSREAYEAFERHVQNIPEVVECYEVTGPFDYHMKLLVASMNRYNEILEKFLSAELGVEKYFTYVVTRAAKDERTLRVRNIVSPVLA